MWRHSTAAAAARRLSAGCASARLPASLSSPLPGVIAVGAAPQDLARRSFSVGPVTEQVASAGYPESSMSRNLLDKCIEAALGRGVDVAGEYHPWLPVDLFQTMLVDIHEYSGCSWLAAITFTCIGIRIITLPISIASIRGAREKAILQPEFQELMAKQNAIKMEGGDQEKNAEIQQKIQAFTQKHGKFFMMKGMWNLFLFQMPLYITAFAALRGMAGHPDIFRGFAMEAPLWLDSLALADPYYILPVLSSAIMLTNTELFGSVDTETASASPLGEATDDKQASAAGGLALGQNTMQKYQKHFMRGSAVFFVPFTMSFPAGVFVFMSTNMLASALQNKLLRNPAMERLLEIPPRAEQIAKTNAIASGTPALVPLGMALRNRSAQSLLGTPQQLPVAPAATSAKAPMADAASQPMIDASPNPLVKAELQEAAAMLAKVNPRYSVRRRSAASAA